MKVIINYDDFITDDNKQIINSVIVEASDSISMKLTKTEVLGSIPEENKNVCEFKIKDTIGLNEVITQIDKGDLRELIEVIKLIYNEL